MLKVETAVERIIDRCTRMENGENIDIYKEMYRYKAICELSEEEIEKVYNRISKCLFGTQEETAEQALEEANKEKAALAALTVSPFKATNEEMKEAIKAIKAFSILKGFTLCITKKECVTREEELKHILSECQEELISWFMVRDAEKKAAEQEEATRADFEDEDNEVAGGILTVNAPIYTTQEQAKKLAVERVKRFEGAREDALILSSLREKTEDRYVFLVNCCFNQYLVTVKLTPTSFPLSDDFEGVEDEGYEEEDWDEDIGEDGRSIMMFSSEEEIKELGFDEEFDYVTIVLDPLTRVKEYRFKTCCKRLSTAVDRFFEILKVDVTVRRLTSVLKMLMLEKNLHSYQRNRYRYEVDDLVDCYSFLLVINPPEDDKK